MSVHTVHTSHFTYAGIHHFLAKRRTKSYTCSSKRQGSIYRIDNRCTRVDRSALPRPVYACMHTLSAQRATAKSYVRSPIHQGFVKNGAATRPAPWITAVVLGDDAYYPAAGDENEVGINEHRRTYTKDGIRYSQSPIHHVERNYQDTAGSSQRSQPSPNHLLFHGSARTRHVRTTCACMRPANDCPARRN